MGLVIDTSTVAPHERTELWSATTSALFFPSEMTFDAAVSYTGWMAQYTLGPLDLQNAFTVGDEAVRAIVISDLPVDAQVSVEEGLFSPGYGRVETRPLVSFRIGLIFPGILKTVFIRAYKGQWKS